MTETKKKKKTLTVAKYKKLVKEFQVMGSEIISRADLARRAGITFEDTRDLWKAVGYPRLITFEDYWENYQRGGVGKRIVEAEPKACWRQHPEVEQKMEKGERGEEGVKTPFEQAWIDLVRERNVFHYFQRADILSRIGRYGVLLIGFDDQRNSLEDEVTRATKVLYLRPYKEDHVVVDQYETDETSERLGLPLIYRLTVSNNEVKGGTKSIRVHWTRVLHIAEGMTENDIEGTPIQKAVWNNLLDLHKVVGSCGEMFFRGAFPGMVFKLMEGAKFGKQTKAAFESEIESYMHNLQRTLKVQGMDIDQLSPQIADPSPTVEVIITIIATTLGYPKRILEGTERGELASSQDENAWNRKIEDRMENYCTPIFIRQFLNRLILVGVMQDVEYEVKWSDISTPTEKEKADVSKVKTEAIATYANSSGADQVVPLEIWMKEVMGFGHDTIEEIKQEVQILIDEEEEDRKTRDKIEKDLFKEQGDRRKRAEEIDKLDLTGVGVKKD